MSERIVPSINSLIKYDNPVLVTKHGDKKVVVKGGIRPCSPTKGAASELKKETEEVLNAILPPKEWEENGNLWIQQVLFLTFFERNISFENGFLFVILFQNLRCQPYQPLG